MDKEELFKLRQEFPVLQRKMNGQPLVYLDFAATAPKPERVIKKEGDFSRLLNANVHRGIYELSEEATREYMAAHRKVADFIGADPEEIIFTSNATEALNLLSYSLAPAFPAGSRILLTVMEHHSNLLPWQRLAKERNLKLDFVELNEEYRLDQKDFLNKLTADTKLASFTHISNVLGTINPVKEMCAKAREAGAYTVVDAAQSAAHLPISVKQLDADFLAFSGHKAYGPWGTGVLYGKKDMLAKMEPFMRGGEMVKEVSREEAVWNELPWKFEAGTPDVAGGIALGEAVDFIKAIGFETISKRERKIIAYALKKLREVEELKIIGPREESLRGGVFSFKLGGIHSHDVAGYLGERGIAIRAGHHCAQPLLKTLELEECSRVSVGITTTEEEIDFLCENLKSCVSELR